MSCERYRDALTDVAAGGPAPAGLEAHLASCEGCREELAWLRRALETAESEMSRVLSEEPSPGLAVRIREAVADPECAPVRVRGWVWPAMAASVVLLTALAVWLVRAPSPERVAGEGKPAPAQSRPAEGGSPASQAAERTASPPLARTLESAREATAPGGVRRRRPPAPSAIATPEVLVPRGEAEALVRFAGLVHRDGQTPAAFLAAGGSSPNLVNPAELVIEPLEIVPLDPAESPGI